MPKLNDYEKLTMYYRVGNMLQILVRVCISRLVVNRRVLSRLFVNTRLVNASKARLIPGAI